MQIQALEQYGVDGIFKEKASGKDNDRAILNWMLDKIYLRKGDTIVVYKLDRLDFQDRMSIRTLIIKFDAGRI